MNRGPVQLPRHFFISKFVPLAIALFVIGAYTSAGSCSALCLTFPFNSPWTLMDCTQDVQWTSLSCNVTRLNQQSSILGAGTPHDPWVEELTWPLSPGFYL